MKKKNEEALNSSKKLKSMMLLINKNKAQTQNTSLRAKSSTPLFYYSRKPASSSTLSLYHSKSQSDVSKKKIINNSKTLNKSLNKNSKLVSLQIQWKKQSIDKEIEQYSINQELIKMYNDLLEQKLQLELEKKGLLIQKNFGIKNEINSSKESIESNVENEKIELIDSKINSINTKIEKISQLNELYNINESIHTNIIGYINNILKNMMLENLQQLMKLYMKEIIELKSRFIHNVFSTNMESDSLDTLLTELKSAKKPYNLIKYYSKIAYPERLPKSISYIKDNDSIITQEQGDNNTSINETTEDKQQRKKLERRESSKNHYNMEEEYDRMLRSLESLYNIKLQEEIENQKELYNSNSDISKKTSRSAENICNETENEDENGYYPNHKRNLSEQNAIIYSNMINELQQKKNHHKKQQKNKKNNENSIENLSRQRSKTLSDMKLKTESAKHSNESIKIHSDNEIKTNNKYEESFINKVIFNDSDIISNKANSNEVNKNTPNSSSSTKNIFKENYSQYINNKLNMANSKDDYEKSIDQLKCSITEKICANIKKEIQNTYDIDISKKVIKNNNSNSNIKKIHNGITNKSSESIKEKS